MSGVCSAGLAITALPDARPAATWPVKMASGKFHGLMQAKTPRPARGIGFIEVGRLFQYRGARGAALAVPGGIRLGRIGERLGDRLVIRFGDLAHEDIAVM